MFYKQKVKRELIDYYITICLYEKRAKIILHNIEKFHSLTLNQVVNILKDCCTIKEVLVFVIRKNKLYDYALINAEREISKYQVKDFKMLDYEFANDNLLGFKYKIKEIYHFIDTTPILYK